MQENGNRMKRFHKGDTVVYGASGICRIDEITSQSFCGELREYYVLCSLYSVGEKVFVPTDNAVLTGRMVPVLTKEQIEEVLAGAGRNAPDWIESDEERKARFDEILCSGDRQALIGMVRTLHTHKEKQEKRGRKLHIADERCFREGEKRISEEFAYVLQIEPSQVGEYIRARIPC